MFDLDSWYENLSDPDSEKYEDVKSKLRGLLTGTGETKDTTQGTLISLHDEMFGTSMKEICRVIGLPNTNEMFASFYEDGDVFNTMEGSHGKIFLYPFRDESNEHILRMKARDKSSTKKGRRFRTGPKREVANNPFTRAKSYNNTSYSHCNRINGYATPKVNGYNLGDTSSTYRPPEPSNPVSRVTGISRNTPRQTSRSIDVLYSKSSRKPQQTSYTPGGSGIFDPRKGRTVPSNFTSPPTSPPGSTYTAPTVTSARSVPEVLKSSPSYDKEETYSPIKNHKIINSPSTSSFRSDPSDAEWNAKPLGDCSFSQKVYNSSLGPEAAHTFLVKKNLKGLLQLWMNGLTISRLETEYNRKFQPINYQFFNVTDFTRKYDRSRSKHIDWRTIPSEKISNIFQSQLLKGLDQVSIPGLQEECEKCNEVRPYSELGFKTFLEMLLHLGTVEFSVMENYPDANSFFESGRLGRSSQSFYNFEPLVKKMAQLIVHCEQNHRDLKVIDYIKEYRSFHKEDVQLEKFPRMIDDEQKFIDELIYYTMAEGGKNPLMKDDGVLRIKPKVKVKNQITFSLSRDRFIIPLKSRYKQLPKISSDRLHEVNLQGEIFGYDEIWCTLKKDHEVLVDLQRKLNYHYKLSKPEDRFRNVILPGTPVASLYEQDWLRGEIIGQSSDGKYEVRYVDYGTVESQDIHNLRWLAPKFLLESRLGFPISLFCIKPKQGKYDEVNEIFSEFLRTELEAGDATTFLQIYETPCDGVQPYNVRVILRRNTKEEYIDERIVRACNQQGQLAVYVPIEDTNGTANHDIDDMFDQLDINETYMKQISSEKRVSELTHGLSDSYFGESNMVPSPDSPSNSHSTCSYSDEAISNTEDEYDLHVLYPFDELGKSDLVLLKYSRMFALNDKKSNMDFYIFHVFGKDMFVFDHQIRSCITEDRAYGGSEKLRAKVWLRNLTSIQFIYEKVSKYFCLFEGLSIKKNEYIECLKVLEDEGVYTTGEQVPNMVSLVELKKWSGDSSLKLFVNNPKVRWNKDCCLDIVINSLSALKPQLENPDDDDDDIDSS